jgi:acyl transferase domain-containing protein
VVLLLVELLAYFEPLQFTLVVRSAAPRTSRRAAASLGSVSAPLCPTGLDVALVALEWSLVELWRSRGIEHPLVLGHSVGELVAGAMPMEAGPKLATERGRLMQALPTGEGIMVAT